MTSPWRHESVEGLEPERTILDFGHARTASFVADRNAEISDRAAALTVGGSIERR